MEALNNLVQTYQSYLFLFLGAMVFFSIALNLILLLKIKKISKQSEMFFEGKNGKDLEAVINKNEQDLKKLDADIQELYTISNKINTLSQRSIHRVGVVRFNPFKDIGGDQSFSVALLDGKNTGITFSSLHTREGTRVYVKPILKGKSEKYTLTEEEEKAIQMAIVTKSEKSNL
jgi:hypothetical protein